MWFRLCVDVDTDGRPTGWSVERRDTNGRCDGLVTGDASSAGATRSEVLEHAWRRALDIYGVPMTLFD